MPALYSELHDYNSHRQHNYLKVNTIDIKIYILTKVFKLHIIVIVTYLYCHVDT